MDDTPPPSLELPPLASFWRIASDDLRKNREQFPLLFIFEIAYFK